MTSFRITMNIVDKSHKPISKSIKVGIAKHPTFHLPSLSIHFLCSFEENEPKDQPAGWQE